MKTNEDFESLSKTCPPVTCVGCGHIVAEEDINYEIAVAITTGEGHVFYHEECYRLESFMKETAPTLGDPHETRLMLLDAKDYIGWIEKDVANITYSLEQISHLLDETVRNLHALAEVSQKRTE